MGYREDKKWKPEEGGERTDVGWKRSKELCDEEIAFGVSHETKTCWGERRRRRRVGRKKTRGREANVSLPVEVLDAGAGG
jgi:hypothetical protein